MNHIDAEIIKFFNQFSRKSWLFDAAMEILDGMDLLKGGVIVGILWALWFSSKEEKVVTETRRTIIATFAGACIALFLSRFLAYILPFRLRPRFDPALHFRLPLYTKLGGLGDWSAFPSDHATLFLAFVAGILLISRRLGLFSLVYVFIMILFPRIYLGLHYLTDVVAGALLGLMVAMLVNGIKIKRRIADPLLEWSEKSPFWFYGISFLIAYETADLYSHVRRFGEFALRFSQEVAQRYF
jgi:undecaprenyl-diphosphatase